MSEFMSYTSNTLLQREAKDPIDLTQGDVYNPERISSYVAEGAGWRMLYGAERITPSVFHALEKMAIEADVHGQMLRMQKGEIVNRVAGESSENRAALHTATRDFLTPTKHTGFAKKGANLAEEQYKKLSQFLEDIDREGKYNTLIVVGIGGSDLGPRAHYYALEYLLKKGRKVFFVSNVDPDEVAHVWRQIAPDQTIVVVISKSGTTLETQINEELLRNKFEKMEIDPCRIFISVTMPETPMDDSRRYANVFYIWDWIGGRYSTTSMVGGIVIGFAFGIEVYREFLIGAHEMDVTALNHNLKENPPLLSALLAIWNHNFLGMSTYAVIPYIQGLHRYPAHLQQLEMESNGKRVGREGKEVLFQTAPVVWGEPGTNAQHSFFQMLHQGTQEVPLLLIGATESQYGEDLTINGTTSQQKLLGNLFGQSRALAKGVHSSSSNAYCPGNRPNTVLLTRKLTPRTLGALLAFFEHRTVFQGFIWNINSFDQEGVQLGKRMADQMIQLFQGGGNDPIGHAYITSLP